MHQCQGLAEGSGDRIYNGKDPVFFKKRADGRYIVKHATWSIAVYYGCIFVVMVIRKEGFQFLYIESVLIISGIKLRSASVTWKTKSAKPFP